MICLDEFTVPRVSPGKKTALPGNGGSIADPDGERHLRRRKRLQTSSTQACAGTVEDDGLPGIRIRKEAIPGAALAGT
jgi:hypothetical protein